MELTVTSAIGRHGDTNLTITGAPGYWGLLRFDRDAATIQGYCATPGPGGAEALADVRPVRMTTPLLRVEGGNDVRIEAIARFLSAHSMGLDLLRQEERLKGDQSRQGIRSQISTWESFLGDGAATPKSSAGEDLDLSVGFQKADIDILGYFQLISRHRTDSISPRRDAPMELGSPVSGLKAIRIQKMVTGKTPDIDLDAAKVALAAVAKPSSGAVSWYGTRDPDMARIRAQAAASYPVLAGMVADSPVLSRAVERQDALQPLLTERTGLAKAALKRLGKVRKPLPEGRLFERGGAVHGEDALGVDRDRRSFTSGVATLETCLRHLKDMPADRIPDSDAGWSAFHDILAGCAIPLENAMGMKASDILAPAKGDWVKFHSTLAKAADFDAENFTRRAMALTALDAADAVEHMSRTAVLPLCLSTISEEDEEIPPISEEFFTRARAASVGIICGKAKNPAGTLFEMSRRYASRVGPIVAVMNGDMGEEERPAYAQDAFPVLCEAHTDPESGITISPLRSFRELSEEGSALDHCVGGYTYQARYAMSHIFSVRNKEGERLTTLEVSNFKGETLEESLWNLRERQHRGFGNALPTEDVKSATDRWMTSLKAGRIAVNFKEIVAWRQHMEEHGPGDQRLLSRDPGWTGGLDFDHTDDDLRNRLWQEWAQVLGGSWAKADNPGILWRDKEARDLLAAMSPMTAAALAERARAAKAEANESPAP